LRLLSEESADNSSQRADMELALSKAIDVTALSMKKDSESSKSKREKHREYEHECREKLSNAEVQSSSEDADIHLVPKIDSNMSDDKDAHIGSMTKMDEKPIEEVTMLSYQRKVTILYLLLSACLADSRNDNKKCSRRRKGYDARHRVALRLLATWLDIKWAKMVCNTTSWYSVGHYKCG
jgi:hypothetical protein